LEKVKNTSLVTIAVVGAILRKGNEMDDDENYSYLGGRLRVALTSTGAKLPTRAHPDDAGLDLYSPIAVRLFPAGSGTEDNERVQIDIGVAIDLNHDEVGLILPRSSMNAKGIHCSTGVIDAGYKGPISVVLQNLNSDYSYAVRAGERIAQLVILPVRRPDVVEVESLDTSTSRGTAGFGSTGK
jgi:dUTP pyrophosphatase